ncbi:MAG: FliM/FliN family flagellar motor switch protein [Roseiarcus sp.]|jgi:flagellar motor switch protein FliM|uniref:FliM/FliN family flagellar motor switch protein n=1 Tax=Roseiarcus sp. TaxID=1969460 RepID=UPI003C1BE40B
MPRAERESSAASAPWLQGAQPDSAGQAIERLPGLAFAFEQFALNIPAAAGSLLKLETAPTLDAIRPETAFTALGECEGQLAAVLHSGALDAKLMLIFDPKIAESLIATVFGDESVSVGERPPRSATTIEFHLVAELARRFAGALEAAFDGFGSLELRLDRLEKLADVYGLGRRDGPTVEARLTLATRLGPLALAVLAQQAALAPLRKQLATEPGAEAGGGDPRWARQLERGVVRARVAVSAVLDELPMSLGDIAALSVGQVLTLHGSGMGRVRLECEGREMFWCKLGQGDGRYSLEIEAAVELEDNSIESALAN